MNPPPPARLPLFFFHLHKCGGTTFINAAAANGHRFASPCRCGLPLVSGGWKPTCDPMETGDGEIREFWNEPEAEARRWIHHLLTTGVDCLVQEYGPYNPALWHGFFRTLCIRHPIDRIYSDFRHQQDEGKIAPHLTFPAWLEAGHMPRSMAALFCDQLGNGSPAVASSRLTDFHVIMVMEHYDLTPMSGYGWHSLDAARHYKSWTPRRSETGRSVLHSCPALRLRMEKECAGDIAVYERARSHIVNAGPSGPGEMGSVLR